MLLTSRFGPTPDLVFLLAAALKRGHIRPSRNLQVEPLQAVLVGPNGAVVARVPAGAGHLRADALAARLPRRSWQRLSAGDGAKGRRYHDWAWISIPGSRPGYRWLLIRRTPRTGELAFYRCYAPQQVPLAALVKVAGRRWTVEENFQAGKGLAGLDEHQVRRWTSWYRWATLAMLASAFLTIAAATEHARTPAPPDQIPLTRNEIAHLLATLTSPAHHARHRMRWSRWRRRHQHRARTCHYQRQSRRQ